MEVRFIINDVEVVRVGGALLLSITHIRYTPTSGTAKKSSYHTKVRFLKTFSNLIKKLKISIKILLIKLISLNLFHKLKIYLLGYIS